MADLTAHESERLRVQKVGQVYRNKGYDVLIEPRGDQLPDFLQAFQPDLIAHKSDEHIVVEVRIRGQVSDFPQVNELSKVVRNEADWKFELFLLGPENSFFVNGARLFTVEEIRSKRKEVALFVENGHLEAAFLMGWSLLEATLRVLAVKEGIEGETATPDYLLKQMTFEGIIARETYHGLKHAQKTRDVIAHGFKSSQLTVETVQELIDLIDGELLQELDNVTEE